MAKSPSPIWNRQRQRWTYDFEHNAERHRGYLVDPDTGQPAKTQREASLYLARIRARLPVQRGRGRAPEPGTYTLGEAMAAHAKKVRSVIAARKRIALEDTEGVGHLRNVVRYIAEIIGRFGRGTAVIDISEEQIDEYIEWMQRQPVKLWKGGHLRDADDPQNASFWVDSGRTRSPATCNQYLNCLSGAFTQAKKKRCPVTRRSLLPEPPVINFLPEGTRVPTPIANREIHAIANAASPHLADMVDLKHAFALRKNEVLKAQRSWIEWELGGLRLPGSLTKSGNDHFKKGSAAAMAVLERLDRQAAQRGVEHLITWGGFGELNRQLARLRGVLVASPPDVQWVALKNVKSAWRGAMARAGIDDGKRRRLHDIRASRITAVAAVASGPATQEYAGHANYKTTQAYIALAQSQTPIDAADQQAPLRVVLPAKPGPRPIGPDDRGPKGGGRRAPVAAALRHANGSGAKSPTRVPNGPSNVVQVFDKSKEIVRTPNSIRVRPKA